MMVAYSPAAQRRSSFEPSQARQIAFVKSQECNGVMKREGEIQWPELSAPAMTDAKRQEFSTLSTSQQILFYIVISTTPNDLQ